ncbi:PTS sugar transporter subunit IIC [Streptomyces sp. MAR4 CNX-425]|uniref:PTS sugar transporter subunit IIC n=1 Tax=Streptomyces sp. MAR4 CNX-425 TaxID=3406343 RepID=UPI003B508E1B
MSLQMSLLVAVIVGLAYLARRIAGDPQLERPIVLGPILGLLLGDLDTGLVVGGTMELIFIGAAPFGGTAPPNVAIGTAVGVSIAIETGQGVESVLVAAVPAAVLGTFFELFAKGSSSFLVHYIDRAAEADDGRRIFATMWCSNAIHFLSYAVPTFMAVHFGAPAVESVVDALDGRVNDGLLTAAAILPAVGFGILLSVLFTKTLFPVFLIGFALAAYTEFTVLGVALLATALVLVLQRSRATASPPTPVA